MKILFVSEFFPPVTFGGAEWSTYYLAKELSGKKDFKVFVLTPDYGVKNNDEGGLNVVRFPFYLKIKKNSVFPSSIHFINPIWFFSCVLNVYRVVKENNVDLIHINGKYSIGPARFANLFLRKKILLTARDYTLLCNYGLCLNANDKACNIINYFKKDFAQYVDEYLHDKNFLFIILNFMFAVYGRLVTEYLKLSARNLPIVLLSKKQSEIYRENGFKKTFIVGNSISFPTKQQKIKKENLIVYAGRLTPGKGVNLLIRIVPLLLKRYPAYRFIFCGSGLLENEIRNLSQKDKRIEFHLKMDHGKLLKLFSKAKLVVVPSVWQEPFGRVALESISQCTPVVVSNRGGLPEVVADKIWGFVSEPEEKSLLSNIYKAIDNNQFLSGNIKKNYKQVTKRFGMNIVDSYVKIYNNI